MLFDKPYSTALKRLFDSGPLPKLGLERMHVLMAALGNPQDTYPIFHIAGTNGKGSTCAFLESILRHAGYRVGLYTSPHLTCARERIQINRELISEADFVSLEERVGKNPTFFERMTAMAFLYFAQAKVDVAVIEVGLGGRLDATNIVNPVACGISRIDLDHQEILGDTLEQIAFEKAGIIKPGVPVVWSSQDPRVEAVFPLPLWERVRVRGELGLRGLHQQDNASLAVSMIKASQFPVSDEAIAKGLKEANWPCRYELIHEGLLLDGAHNPAGTRALIKALQEDKRIPDILWVAMTEGHESHEMASLWQQAFPEMKIIAGQSKSRRALPVNQVAECFRQVGFQTSPLTPLHQVERGIGELTVATGSLYWTGEIRSRLIQMPIDNLAMFY